MQLPVRPGGKEELFFDNMHPENADGGSFVQAVYQRVKKSNAAGTDRERKSTPVWTGFNPGCNGIAALNSGVDPGLN